MALDQSTKIGWAVGSPASGPVAWGMHHIDPDQLRKDLPFGDFLVAYRDFLVVMTERFKVTDLAFERVYLDADTHPDILTRLCSLAGHTELFCIGHKLGCHPVHLTEWRARFIGCTQAPRHPERTKSQRSAWLKARAREECATRGWPTDSDDEAEALGIFDYQCAQMSKAYDLKGTLLDGAVA